MRIRRRPSSMTGGGITRRSRRASLRMIKRVRKKYTAVEALVRRRTTMSQEFVGPLTVTSPQGVQGGSLELGATLGPTPDTPYVDFHFGLGAAQDFNVRLINPADNRLDVVTALGGKIGRASCRERVEGGVVGGRSER